MKLGLNSKEQVEKILVEGAWIKDIKVDIQNIQKERTNSTKIRQCFKCPKYTHYAKQCKSETEFCTVGAGTHNFKVCPNRQTPKCRNCNRSQIAISNKCFTQQDKQMQSECDNKSTAPAQPPQQLPSLPASTANETGSEFLYQEGEMKFAAAKIDAEMEANGDPYIFLQIMNSFFQANGMSQIHITTEQNTYAHTVRQHTHSQPDHTNPPCSSPQSHQNSTISNIIHAHHTTIHPCPPPTNSHSVVFTIILTTPSPGSLPHTNPSQHTNIGTKSKTPLHKS